MNWIELMGPSGIGKSTFLNSLSPLRKSKNEWVYLNEGLEILAKTNSSSSVSNKILKHYLNQNFLNTKKNLVVKSLLNGKNAYLNNGYKYNALLDSNLKYYSNLTAISAVEKTYRISLYKSIIEQICIFDFYNYTNLVLLDEGPLNHHPDLINNDFVKKENTPKGIVFCHLDVDENFNRIKKREKNGRLVPLHDGLNDIELKKFIVKNNDHYLRKRDILISEGIPYKDIDLKEVNKTQLVEVIKFLNKFNKI